MLQGSLEYVTKSIKSSLSGPIHHWTQNNIDLVNRDELYKPFTNIFLQTICYLMKDFNDFMKRQSDFEVFNFKCWPNDLTGYGNNNIKTLRNYCFNHGYLSKEEKEKIINEWLEFWSKINFVAKKKNTLIEMFQCILLENSTELKNIMLLIQIMMNMSVSTATCERGLSKLHAQKISLRTRMNT